MSETRLKYGQLAPEGLARMSGLEHYLNHETGLEASLLGLVRLRTSLMNGCEYCIHMHTAELKKLNHPVRTIVVHVKARFQTQVFAEVRALNLPQVEFAHFDVPYVF